MKDILSEIIAHKQIEIAQQKQAVSIEHLQKTVDAMMQEEADAQPTDRVQHRSMKRALATSASGIIAEFKRRSPSKGWIKQEAQAHLIPPAYEAAGAAALSILTDEMFFSGTLRDIRTARPLVNLPILRKDFIIDEYQLMQARIVGADAVLLIAACLTPDRCHELTLQAHELGLEVLLELHTPSEFSHICKETDMIGINNRNLGSFVTHVENSFRIAEQLKETIVQINFETAPVLVSESGISSSETIRELRSTRFQGFLIGETFMRTENPGNALKELIGEVSAFNS
ncbi:indole-3-glycerol phosphate synthase TrpC [uncultured Bacteroides sp.]|uniref:indole-3-glycerol phosphate synthase TrpC n=1 Tax=uncultured Bacteroides sp. TaxID=162156 RepID=UPI0026098C6C|nr:indole-3-glycerol phosphate synthase TrpC [uncultured Bacteroides sp.]